jgi:hypothetical protein
MYVINLSRIESVEKNFLGTAKPKHSAGVKQTDLRRSNASVSDEVTFPCRKNLYYGDFGRWTTS